MSERLAPEQLLPEHLRLKPGESAEDFGRRQAEAEARKITEDAGWQDLAARGALAELAAAEAQRQEAAKADAFFQQVGEKAAAAMKAAALRSYLAGGGCERDFEQDWPAIRAQLLAERVIEGQRESEHRMRSYW